MDYEKKYNEALELARKIHSGEGVDAPAGWSTLETIFPELRESEDEMIRRTLVEYFGPNVQLDFVRGVPIQKIRDWIEKQKPAIWSEEDETILDSVIRIITQYDDLAHEPTFAGPKWTHPYTKEIAWLKSLRPQPQGTYKLIVHNIYEMLKDKDFFDIPPSHRVSLLNDIRVRCKNADEQAEILGVPSWKPSEEQMKALEIAFRKDGDDKYRSTINSLYNDLKKL